MTEPHTTQRLPHAVLDLPSRRLKALKIERLLNLDSTLNPIKLLEIGTGSGGIAHYFAHHRHLQCEVEAVDVHDQRLLTDGYSFHQVKDTSLPFPDDYFDVVITNHVIEHVGDKEAQLHHLQEIHRVMNPKGKGYLAVPNRWMLIEPHYRLAFLSWLPTSLRTPYLRVMGRGNEYDCDPPSLREIEHMLGICNFNYENLSTKAIRETVKIEGKQGGVVSIANALPDTILNKMACINPTLIYKFARA